MATETLKSICNNDNNVDDSLDDLSFQTANDILSESVGFFKSDGLSESEQADGLSKSEQDDRLSKQPCENPVCVHEKRELREEISRLQRQYQNKDEKIQNMVILEKNVTETDRPLQDQKENSRDTENRLTKFDETPRIHLSKKRKSTEQQHSDILLKRKSIAYAEAEQKAVEFRYNSPATKVSIMGSWNGWKPERKMNWNGSYFTCELHLITGEYYEYIYKVGDPAEGKLDPSQEVTEDGKYHCIRI